MSADAAATAKNEVRQEYAARKEPMGIPANWELAMPAIVRIARREKNPVARPLEKG